MSVRIIKVPDIGEGIAEVEVTAWHVRVGDRVAEDQALADVMTDKANVEIPSPVAGSVLALGGEVGGVLAVGSELIRIEVEAAGDAREVAVAPIDKTAAAAPAPKPAAKAAAVAPPPAVRARATEDRPIASPSVRRRAWELGIELKDVAPSGTAGRIAQADLDAHAAKHAKPAAPSRPAARAVNSGAERNDEQQVRVIGVRRKIAQKMQESKRRIPHFTYVEEVDVTEVEALRARLNEMHGSERGRLTLLPLLMRAVVLALRDFPQINARFDDDAGVVTRHGAVHLGIATQTANGLMVPVVRHAEARDLWSSAAEVARLSEAARAGNATRDELTGSTITITSLGALGGIVSTPVINHPEVAIVGVNRIVERPLIVRGAIVARQVMNLSSSFDHRVVDGVDAARFVQAVRGYLEVPATLFVE